MADAGSLKTLSELRVVDLKNELELRSLPLHGVKAVLVERLQKALTEEGENVETHLFEVSETPKRVSSKKKLDDSASNEDLIDDQDILTTELHSAASSETVNLQIQDSDDVNLTMKNQSEQENVVTPSVGKDNDDLSNDGQGDALDGADVAVPSDEGSFRVPSPTAVEPENQFTTEETIAMHQVTDAKRAIDDTASTMVNFDETQSGTLEDGGSTVGSMSNKLPSASGQPFDLHQAGDSVSETGCEEESPKMGDLVPPSGGTEEEAAILKSESTEQNSEVATKDTGDDDIECKSTDSTVKNVQVEAEATAGTTISTSAKGNVTESTVTSGRSLWISNLASTTRATDLKQLFSKYGRVITAKIVTSAKLSPSKCFGFLVMSNVEEASKCIQHLHRTEFNQRTITVERSKNDNALPLRKPAATVVSKPTASTSTTKDVKPVVSSVPTKTSSSGTKESSDKKDDKAKAAARSTSQSRSSDRRRDTASRTRTRDVVDKYKSRSSALKDRSSDDYRSRTSSSRGVRGRFGASRTYRSSFSSRRPPGPSRFGGSYRDSFRDREPNYRDDPGFGGGPVPFEDNRERMMMERMRQREIEHIHREQQLRLEKEKEHLRFERERIQREKLELERMKYEHELEQMQLAAKAGMKRSYGNASYMEEQMGPPMKRYMPSSGARSDSRSSGSRHRDGASRHNYEGRGGEPSMYESQQASKSRTGGSYSASASSIDRRRLDDRSRGAETSRGGHAAFDQYRSGGSARSSYGHQDGGVYTSDSKGHSSTRDRSSRDVRPPAGRGPPPPSSSHTSRRDYSNANQVPMGQQAEAGWRPGGSSSFRGGGSRGGSFAQSSRGMIESSYGGAGDTKQQYWQQGNYDHRRQPQAPWERQSGGKLAATPGYGRPPTTFE